MTKKLKKMNETQTKTQQTEGLQFNHEQYFSYFLINGWIVAES
jgi:hypothetical protein